MYGGKETQQKGVASTTVPSVTRRATIRDRRISITQQFQSHLVIHWVVKREPIPHTRKQISHRTPRIFTKRIPKEPAYVLRCLRKPVPGSACSIQRTRYIRNKTTYITGKV